MGPEIVFLVLIAVVRLRLRRPAGEPGVGRPGRRGGCGDPLGLLARTVPARPDLAPDSVVSVEDEESEADVLVVDEAVEEVVAERPGFRDRMGKARARATGLLVGVRSRPGIDAETWDDLEEALLRADVGVGPVATDALLQPLRGTVTAKEITDPRGLARCASVTR